MGFCYRTHLRAIFFVVEIFKSSFTRSKLKVKNFCLFDHQLNMMSCKAFFIKSGSSLPHVRDKTWPEFWS